MSKKATVRLVCYFLAALAVLGGFLLEANGRAARFEQQVNNSYRLAFNEFATGVREVANSLEKSHYASGQATFTALCTDVYGKATAAQAALAQLPLSGELDKTSSFLAKVGDYAYALSSGDGAEQADYDNLTALAGAARQLSDTLENLSADVDSGAVLIAALRQTEQSAPLLEQSIRAAETEFPEVPSLIYDGPFSEHLLTAEPLYLEGKQEIDRQEARLRGALLLEADPNQLHFETERAGTVPAWTFSCTVNGSEKYITLTKQGGVPLSILSVRQVQRSNLSDGDGLKIAEKFLTDAGFVNMTDTYTIRQDNVLTVNFAYLLGDVICYPDLVKVSVALDNGEVTGFESLGFVMSHTTRTLASPTVTEEAARAAVSGELTVLEHRFALIPTDGQYEKFCHEFTCENGDGRHYLVYVGVESGRQEKILILLEDENGTLTI